MTWFMQCTVTLLSFVAEDTVIRHQRGVHVVLHTQPVALTTTPVSALLLL
jgi:hypothetical protein